MKTNPTTRADLALLVPTSGTVIELGVAAGRFAAEMLAKNPAMKYLGIDRWSDHHDETEMINAHQRLGLFKFTQSLTKSLPIR